jgi:hypothetical protein
MTGRDVPAWYGKLGRGLRYLAGGLSANAHHVAWLPGVATASAPERPLTSPPPGHPDQLYPAPPLTRVERELWRHLEAEMCSAPRRADRPGLAANLCRRLERTAPWWTSRFPRSPG